MAISSGLAETNFIEIPIPPMPQFKACVIESTTNLTCGDMVTPSATYHFDRPLWQNRWDFTLSTNYVTNTVTDTSNPVVINKPVIQQIATNLIMTLPRTPGAAAEFYKIVGYNPESL